MAGRRFDPARRSTWPEQMPCLTVHQPWAHLIAVGRKRVENRSWSTRHRGPLAIHAGSSRATWLQHGHGLSSHELAWGAVIAVARLAALVHVEALRDTRSLGEYEWLRNHEYCAGPWLWVLEDVVRIPPEPATGAQGLWLWAPSQAPTAEVSP